MRLTFLGTGPSSPIPRLYCSCPTCREARHSKSKTARLRSSALLYLGGHRHILFDVTPDVLKQLEAVRTFCVDAVFLTHGHNDAVGGFFDLNDILRQQGHPAVLYTEQETWQRIKRNLDETKPWFKIKIIKPGEPFKVFGLKIISFRVVHSAIKGFPTLGFRIGKSFVYASDFYKLPCASEKFIKNIPQAILDGCMWFGRQIPTHLNVEQSIRLAQKLNIRHLYLTQISHKYPPYQIAQREIDKYCRQNKIRTKVRLAWDGMKLEL